MMILLNKLKFYNCAPDNLTVIRKAVPVVNRRRTNKKNWFPIIIDDGRRPRRSHNNFGDDGDNEYSSVAMV